MGENSIMPSENWAFLNPDLLRLIYKKLYDTFDFIHFRAVCKLWRAAAPLSDHPPQYPFFLYRDDNDSSEFKLYSYTGKTRTLQVPKACGKKFSGQSQGYLIMYPNSDRDRNTDAVFLNPFTRAERQLSLRGYSYIEPFHVSGDPIGNAGDVIMHMWRRPFQCKFVRLRENEYTECNTGFPYHATTYYKERIFYLDNFNCNRTMVAYLTSGIPLSRIESPYTGSGLTSLVEGPGTLFSIMERICTKRKTVPLEDCCFDVYKLDEDEKPLQWVKQTNIGDLMIFVNFARGFCLSASDFDGIRGNCVIFVKKYHGNERLIGRYDLGMDKSEVIAKVGSHGYWIVPNVY